MDSRSDEQLIAIFVQDGDQQTFEVLYEKYNKSLCVYFTRKIGDDIEAQDLAQETFLKCYRSANTYKPEIASVKTWLFKIAHNTAMDYFKRRQRERASLEKYLEMRYRRGSRMY